MKGSESSLQVRGVGLEIVKSASNAGLKLRWLLARRAVGRDLVDGAHDCGGVVVVRREGREGSSKSIVYNFFDILATVRKSIFCGSSLASDHVNYPLFCAFLSARWGSEN